MSKTFIPGATAATRTGVGVVFAFLFYLAVALAVVTVVRGRMVDPETVSVVIAAVLVWWGACVSSARWGAVGRTLPGSRAAGGGLLLFGAAITLCALAPAWTGDPLAIGAASDQLAAPNWDHPMGTDRLGRDVLARLVYGARTTIGIALAAVLLSLLIGTAVGAVAAMAGRRTDEWIMRGVDALLAIPRLLLVLLVTAAWDNTLLLVVAVLALTGWMGVARLVRGELRHLAAAPFVEAAVAGGASRWRVVSRELLPNVAGALAVAATLNIGAVVLLESYLSFLGLGVQPPWPTLGGMVRESRATMGEAWWATVFPALGIAVTVVAANLMGEGVGESRRGE